MCITSLLNNWYEETQNLASLVGYDALNEEINREGPFAAQSSWLFAAVLGFKDSFLVGINGHVDRRTRKG